MVAARQSSHRLELGGSSLKALRISYDGSPRISAADSEATAKEAYARGYEEASSQYNQQIVDFRAEVNALSEGAFSELESRFAKIVNEAREALMSLTYESVVRTLGGYELPKEAVGGIVNAIIEESGLSEEKMEVRLNPKDVELLSDLQPEIKAHHPGLEFVEDVTLRRGDCLLSSRFGKVDGLMSTKLERLKGSLRPE